MKDNIDIKTIIEKINKLEIRFNKDIDDMKNIINEKDMIINELNKKIEKITKIFNEYNINNEEKNNENDNKINKINKDIEQNERAINDLKEKLNKNINRIDKDMNIIKSDLLLLNKEREIITNKSTEEDVSKYLKKNLGFPSKIIEELALDGESLFLLENYDIDEFDILTMEQKAKLKNLINNIKQNII